MYVCVCVRRVCATVNSTAAHLSFLCPICCCSHEDQALPCHSIPLHCMHPVANALLLPHISRLSLSPPPPPPRYPPFHHNPYPHLQQAIVPPATSRRAPRLGSPSPGPRGISPSMEKVGAPPPSYDAGIGYANTGSGDLQALRVDAALRAREQKVAAAAPGGSVPGSASAGPPGGDIGGGNSVVSNGSTFVSGGSTFESGASVGSGDTIPAGAGAGAAATRRGSGSGGTGGSGSTYSSSASSSAASAAAQEAAAAGRRASSSAADAVAAAAAAADARTQEVCVCVRVREIRVYMRSQA